jgi:hypothetical protein
MSRECVLIDLIIQPNASCFEHGNFPCDSIKAVKFLDQLNCQQLLKLNSASWNKIAVKI